MVETRTMFAHSVKAEQRPLCPCAPAIREMPASVWLRVSTLREGVGPRHSHGPLPRNCAAHGGVADGRPLQAARAGALTTVSADTPACLGAGRCQLIR